VKKTALGMVVAGLALATSAFAQAGGPPAVKGATLVIEDFESYPSDAACPAQASTCWPADARANR
jgi:hypothetical protein